MSAGGGEITLPGWVALLATGQEGRPEQRDSPGEQLRAGPLRVFAPAAGCEIARFGHGGASVALADGYLLDRRALAGELGLEAAGATTAELAAGAYERWGEEMFTRLDGGFLIAVWDAAERRLVAGHDGLGSCPLYYAERPEGLWLASNILALADRAGLRGEPDRLSLALRLLVKWPRAGETFFAGIRRARPGHYLVRPADGTLRAQRYWQPISDEDEPMIGPEETAERFAPLFEEAVARCLEAGAQGIMLSGGLDSVSVAAVAAAKRRELGLDPLTACCGKNPPGYPSSHEEAMQDRVAERLGMPLLTGHAEQWLGGRELLPATLELIGELPSPTNVYWTAAYVGFYRQAAGAGVRKLMTGSGGDEWLGVHDAHAADLLRRLALGPLYRFLRATAGTGGRGWRRATADLIFRQALGRPAGGLWARLAPANRLEHHRRRARGRLPAWFCPDPELAEEVVETLVASGPTPDLAADGRLPANHYLHAIRHLFNRNPYMTYELERRHHVTAMAGIRLMSPFLQRESIGFLVRVAPAVLLEADRTKALLRRVVAERLPGLDLEHQRKSYRPPTERYLEQALPRELPGSWQRVGCERLERLGLVRREALQAAVEGGTGELLPAAQLFTALSAERWLAAQGV